MFASAIGITAEHTEELREAILRAATTTEATPAEEDDYGQRFTVDFVMSGPRGQARVRSTWIIRKDEDFPRLTSCYVL